MSATIIEARSVDMLFTTRKGCLTAHRLLRAYNAYLSTTRRCCVGIERDCDTCVDLWAISGWIVGAMKNHLKSYKDFVNWLCSTYLFYLQTGFIDLNKGAYLLPDIYHKMGIIKDN